MKTLTQLYESYKAINAKVTPGMHKLMMKVEQLGFPVKIKDGLWPRSLVLSAQLPKGTVKLDQDLARYIDTLQDYDILLMVDVKVGFDKPTENVVNFVFPYIQNPAAVCYHVTSARNIDSIMEKGLLSMRPSITSDTVMQHGVGESFRERMYKAVFMTSTLEDVDKIKDMFDFEDPQVLEIDTRGLCCYADPMMPDGMGSVVHFYDIEPTRLKNITNTL